MMALLLLLAAEFWEAKPYANWSEQEVARVLVDSPWAKEVFIRWEGDIDQRLRDAQRTPAPAPASASGVSQRGGSGGGPIGSMVGGRKGVPIPAGATVHVRWESAKPLRQAIAATKKAAVAPEPDHYTLVIDHIPPFMETREPANLRDVLLQITELTWDKSPPVRPSDAAVTANADGLIVRLTFPRYPDAAQASGVELHTRIGVSRVRCAFKLRPMRIAGRLEL